MKILPGLYLKGIVAQPPIKVPMINKMIVSITEFFYFVKIVADLIPSLIINSGPVSP